MMSAPSDVSALSQARVRQSRQKEAAGVAEAGLCKLNGAKVAGGSRSEWCASAGRGEAQGWTLAEAEVWLFWGMLDTRKKGLVRQQGVKRRSPAKHAKFSGCGHGLHAGTMTRGGGERS